MALQLPPDAEKAISKYLREHPAIVAIGARVVGKTPAAGARDTPWVRVTQLDASQAARDTADHLIAFYLQFDCYAGATGGQPEASLLSRTVRALLRDVASYASPDAVITGAQINSAARIPDTEGFEPARERFIVTAFVWAHAA